MGLDLAEVCRQIYVDTLEMREKHKAGLGPLYDFAFKILHAPPRAHPPVLFIGIQPGGDKADTASREMFTWPDKLDYETGDWPLANYIRNLFKDHLDVLRACHVTNANFFRSPRQKGSAENSGSFAASAGTGNGVQNSSGLIRCSRKART